MADALSLLVAPGDAESRREGDGEAVEERDGEGERVAEPLGATEALPLPLPLPLAELRAVAETREVTEGGSLGVAAGVDEGGEEAEGRGPEGEGVAETHGDRSAEGDPQAVRVPPPSSAAAPSGGEGVGADDEDALLERETRGEGVPLAPLGEGDGEGPVGTADGVSPSTNDGDAESDVAPEALAGAAVEEPRASLPLTRGVPLSEDVREGEAVGAPVGEAPPEAETEAVLLRELKGDADREGDTLPVGEDEPLRVGSGEAVGRAGEGDAEAVGAPREAVGARTVPEGEPEALPPPPAERDGGAEPVGPPAGEPVGAPVPLPRGAALPVAACVAVVGEDAEAPPLGDGAPEPLHRALGEVPPLRVAMPPLPVAGGEALTAPGADVPLPGAVPVRIAEGDAGGDAEAPPRGEGVPVGVLLPSGEALLDAVLLALGAAEREAVGEGGAQGEGEAVGGGEAVGEGELMGEGEGGGVGEGEAEGGAPVRDAAPLPEGGAAVPLGDPVAVPASAEAEEAPEGVGDTLPVTLTFAERLLDCDSEGVALPLLLREGGGEALPEPQPEGVGERRGDGDAEGEPEGDAERRKEAVSTRGEGVPVDVGAPALAVAAPRSDALVAPLADASPEGLAAALPVAVGEVMGERGALGDALCVGAAGEGEPGGPVGEGGGEALRAPLGEAGGEPVDAPLPLGARTLLLPLRLSSGERDADTEPDAEGVPPPSSALTEGAPVAEALPQGDALAPPGGEGEAGAELEALPEGAAGVPEGRAETLPTRAVEDGGAETLPTPPAPPSSAPPALALPLAEAQGEGAPEALPRGDALREAVKEGESVCVRETAGEPLAEPLSAPLLVALTQPDDEGETVVEDEPVPEAVGGSGVAEALSLMLCEAPEGESEGGAEGEAPSCGEAEVRGEGLPEPHKECEGRGEIDAEGMGDAVREGGAESDASGLREREGVDVAEALPRGEGEGDREETLEDEVARGDSDGGIVRTLLREAEGESEAGREKEGHDEGDALPLWVVLVNALPVLLREALALLVARGETEGVRVAALPPEAVGGATETEVLPDADADAPEGDAEGSGEKEALGEGDAAPERLSVVLGEGAPDGVGDAAAEAEPEGEPVGERVDSAPGSDADGASDEDTLPEADADAPEGDAEGSAEWDTKGLAEAVPTGLPVTLPEGATDVEGDAEAQRDAEGEAEADLLPTPPDAVRAPDAEAVMVPRGDAETLNEKLALAEGGGDAEGEELGSGLVEEL